MKRIKLICVLCLLTLSNAAQNLVPNPSFEIHNDCFFARLDNAIGWNSTNNGAGICAYLMTCQTDQWFQAPKQYLDNCFQSYQTIRTGNAYAHFGLYPLNTSDQESKHPTVKLIDTLKAGTTYCVTYYVSMFNHDNYSIDKLGALFTPTPFPYYVTGTTTPSVAIAGQYTPQVVTAPGVVFEDTLGWEEVSGTFTAVGNEAYLTLGDFFLHNQHLIKNSYPTNCNGVAEYYVDDVSVEEVHPAKAKNDTTIMFGDSTIIGNNPSEAAIYNWQPSTGLSCTNCPNPKASPTITTTYTVTKTQCKSVTTDVITVNVDATGLVSSGAVGNSIKLYPNPVTEILNVECKMINDKSDLQIRLSDVVGREILLTEYKSQFDISDLEKGIYFISILRNGKPLVTQKIVKE